DRRALRVVDVGERRRDDPAGRVVLEARRGLSTLEVAYEGEEAPLDLLLPRDVGDVAGERDVGPARIVGPVRDGLAGVEELEVIAADEPRNEDRMPSATDVLLPHHPRNRRLTRSQAAGGDARVLGVGKSVGGQRARVLALVRLGAGAEVMHARAVEDVRLPLGAAPDRDPLE